MLYNAPQPSANPLIPVNSEREYDYMQAYYTYLKTFFGEFQETVKVFFANKARIGGMHTFAKSWFYTIRGSFLSQKFLLYYQGGLTVMNFSLCQHDVSIYYSSRAASHNRSYNVYMYILLYILSHLLAGLLRKVYF